MEFISTTATAADKINRLAKTLRKTTKTSLAIALDTVAKQHGYQHWKHVTLCEEQTTALRISKPLPDELKAFLNESAAANPILSETQKAFDQGFVFAMDIKDAQDLALQDDYEELEDGWQVAAWDLWRNLIHSRDDETGTTLFETRTEDELLDIVLNDQPNYRFFRFTGTSTPASLEAAYKSIQQMSFFPPTHIWLSGKFIDIHEIPEIKIDGRVVLSNAAGRKVLLNSNTQQDPFA